MQHRHWQDWVTGAIGLWLLVCPFVLRFTLGESASLTPLTANFVIYGGLAILLAVSALAAFRSWGEWLTAGLGFWLILSPWLLAFASSRPAMWNAVGGGALLVALGAWTLFDTGDAGHA